MEGLTHLVTESLVRHGFDRPLDYRRLQWSRWFRCDSHHSLLQVPSKPGVFALAEEITHVGNVAKPALNGLEGAVPRSEASGPMWDGIPEAGIRKPDALPRRMLAVTHFFEDDDMAFVLDRMLSQHNSMRARLLSGRYFVRFVVSEDQSQRRSISTALNQWMACAAEKATGIGSHFASSLELTPATEYVPQADEAQGNLFGDARAERTPSPANAESTTVSREDSEPVARAASPLAAAPHLNSGAAINIHRPSPFPSGF